MSRVYRRGRKLWFHFKDVEGRWVRESSGLDVGQEKAARTMLANIERDIGDAAAEEDRLEQAELRAASLPTLDEWSRAWMVERRTLVRTWEGDAGRLNKHILPALGSRRVDEIAVRDVRAVYID